ncbi:MAG TPA: GspMb/PilO family protein [Pyrinomonadaceae bacterium]|nr:GspMb/PilO family protein [Pyrinomonadaceae bacterium]
MSTPTPTGYTSKRDRIRASFNNLSPREQRLFGPAEIIGLAGSVLILLLVVVSYLYFLVPANSKLVGLQAQRSLLQARLKDLQSMVKRGESTEASVQKINQSLDEFESGHLLGSDSGRMALYDSLNVLIRKNGLRNTSGPTYTTLESSNSKASSTGSRSANTKWQSIYPGIAISVTVEGQYQNLRRFVHDLEANQQFIIINSMELERSTETNNLLPGEGEPTTGTRVSPVSLRLEMTTYFQRSARENGAVNSTAQ